MTERKDLPGASEFIQILTLFIIFKQYPAEYQKTGFNYENYQLKTSGSKTTLKLARDKAVTRFYSNDLDLNFKDFESYILSR